MACNCNKTQPVRKPYGERECAEDAWVRYATQDTATRCPCKDGQYARSGDHVPERGFGELTPAQIELLKRDIAEANRPSWFATRYLGSMGRSHAGHEESAARSREMTEILKRVADLEVRVGGHIAALDIHTKRLAELESISRNHDDVLMGTVQRINRMAKAAVPQYAEEVPGSIKLTPGPITGNAFDAPEHSNAKELPKHAKELRSEVIVEVNSDGSLSVSESSELSKPVGHTFTDETRLRYSDHDLVLRPRVRDVGTYPQATLVTYDATVNGITERRSFRVAPGCVIEIPSRSRVISVTPES